MRKDYSNTNKYLVPNLSKACQVMTRLSESSTGYTVGEMTEEMGIPRTTVLRILTTLCHEGMAYKRGYTYYSGGAMVRLGFQSLSNLEIRSIAVPVMRQLSEETGETSHMGMLSGKSVLLIEVCDGPNPVRVSSRVGTMADLHCSATGKVLLANCVKEPLDEFYQDWPLRERTAKTITSTEALIAEMEKVRAQGYAVDDEEFFIGVRCLAAPIFDAADEVTAAIGITAPTTNFPKNQIKKKAAFVMDAARQISQGIGG